MDRYWPEGARDWSQTETTHQPAALHAYFGYRDAPAAIEWLGRAFGFETTMQFPDDVGGVAHAELRLGDATVVVFSDHDGYERSPARATPWDSGSTSAWRRPPTSTPSMLARSPRAQPGVWEPGASQWNYRCRVVDPEGFEWTFGTHRPGEPQGDWSADVSDDDAWAEGEAST